MGTATNASRDLAAFDNVSLWQLIPSGQGYALSYLRKIVDYVLSQRPERMPAICITGNEGKRTHAVAFLNAIAMDVIREIDARATQAYGGFQSVFEETTSGTGIIITNAQYLPSYSYQTLCQILKERRFAKYDIKTNTSEWIAVHGTPIITATAPTNAMQVIVDQMDYVVQLESYTTEQRRLIALQRIKYCGLRYSGEEVLDMIVQQGEGALSKIVQLLRACIVIVRGEERSEITVKDVRRASLLCQAPETAKAKA